MGQRSILRLGIGIALAALAQPLPAQSIWNAVDQSLGRPGTTQPDGVRRYSFARSDLDVRLDGVAIKPALALGSWLAFQPHGRDSVVMGDLVLTAEEVTPVISALLDGGIEVTALHNHLLRSSPATYYVHVRGEGDARKLAASLHAALARSRTPLGPPAPANPAASDLNIAAIDGIMGRSGKANGAVYQFTVPRAEAIVENGMALPASMGTGTGINFQPAGGGRAAVTGDFVLLGAEVDPVMKALRSGGIEITALHSHMLGETPRLYFMHFWGVGEPAKLATGLRAALNRMNVR
jgi:hypothetical protein